MKNQFTISSPSLFSHNHNSLPRHPPNPQNSDYKPFKAIIQQPSIDQPPHIIQTNNKLHKMKERLQKLVQQTDQLTRPQKQFGGEGRSMNKYTDVQEKRPKQLVGEKSAMPQRNQDLFRAESAKNEECKRYIGFSLEPLQKVNHRNSRKSSPKEEEKKAAETKSCLSIFSLSENFDFKENSATPFPKQNFSLGPNELSNDSFYDHQRRKSMLEFQPEDLMESRYSKSKSCFSHVDDFADYSPNISSKVQMICLEQENKQLHEEVDNLNKSRQYYQQELILGLKKDEEVSESHRKEICQQRKSHEAIVEQYSGKLKSKDKLIKQLMGKIIKTEESSIEKLVSRIQAMDQENQHLKEMLFKKDTQVQSLQAQLAQRQQQNAVLQMENSRLQSSVSSLHAFKTQYSSATPKFDQTLKAQLQEISQLKDEVSSLMDINEKLKSDIAERVKEETDLRNQHRLEIMKESIERKNMQTKYSIEETKQQNVIKSLNNRMRTLEDRIKSNETEIREKDQFLKGFISGRVNMDAETLINEFQARVAERKESEDRLRGKVEQLEKIVRLYEESASRKQV